MNIYSAPESLKGVRGSGVFMYAVFQSGGKQHRVSEGQTVRPKVGHRNWRKLSSFASLMIANGEEVKIGVSFVDGGVQSKAEVVHLGRGEKAKKR